jgi:hypothetical protein
VPETAAAVYSWWTTVAVAGTTITYGTIITTVIAVYGTVDAQSKARARARAQRDAYNAGLTDRTVSIMQADNPWQIIYGEAVVAPAIVATLTSGDRDQYKHVVAVWAVHECQAIEDVRFAGESVGTLDANGYVTSGRYFSTTTETDYQNFTVPITGVMTLSRTPARVISVSHNSGGSGDSENVQTLPPEAYTVVGAVVTIQPAYLDVWAGLLVTVNYDWLRGVPRLRVRHHLGSDDQTADTALMADCPTEWTATDRGRGLCYSVFTFDLNEPEFQGGPPQITGLLKGKRVYDPRADSTQPGGSGAQRVNDSATWGWSDNPALCIADFVRGRYGKAARANQVQWPTVATAANVCDEDWDYEDPDLPRYTCNGSFRTNEDPDSTLDQLCQAMGGFATYMGTWHLQAGSYTAPVMALTDADNAGPVEVVPAPAGDQVMNGLRGRFYNPEAYDQVTDYTPYVNAAFVAEDGETYLGDLDLPFTRSHARCHQLARLQVERSRGMQLVYPAKLRAFSLKPGQRITLSCSALGIVDSIFRVVKREYAAGQAVKLTLQQDDPSYYDATDAPASLPVPTQTSSDPYRVSPPEDLVALSTAAVVLRDDDGTVISRARLTYSPAADVLVRNAGALQVEYRLADEDTWQRHPDAAGDSEELPLLGLQDQRAYVVRARWRSSLGVVSDWASAAVRTSLPSEAGGGGTPGEPALAARLSTYSATFAADSAGVVDAGQSFPVNMVVLLGSTDDTSNWAVSRTSSDTGLTTTLSGATVAITGMGTATNTGWVDITATRSGYPTQTLRVNLAKARRAVPAGGSVTVSIAGGDLAQTVAAGASFGPATMGGRTATATGGTAPYGYSWALVTDGYENNASLWIDGAPVGAAVSVGGQCSSGGDAAATVVVTARDATGATAVAAFRASILSLT